MLKIVELVGEQRKTLTLSPEGPIQIKGTAGSGKTTVAIYRACHLIDSHSDMFEPSKVAIFTFNKTLSAYLKALTQNFNSNDYSDIKVVNFHKWAYAFIEKNGINLRGKTIFGNQTQTLLRPILISITRNSDSERILNKSIDFFCDEISWLKGKRILTLDEYVQTVRSGRGTSDRVLATDRPIIWQVFTKYNEELRRTGKYDFDDYALLCIEIIEKFGNPFVQPFTHLVVDEAQDLSKAQMTVLANLVSKTTNSITVIADAAQRIYKSGFSWKEIGLNVTGGRTIEFKKNYRNTKQIALAALSLLDSDDDSGEFTLAEASTREGEIPSIKQFNDLDSEKSFILQRLKSLQKHSPNESICLLHRTNFGVSNAVNDLQNNQIKCEKINSSSTINYLDNSVKVSTMQSVKGLEFDHVIIYDLTDNNLPISSGFSEPDDEIHITTERRLLYTCMTRAANTLLMTYSGFPSRYFAEINSNLIDEQ